MTHDAGVTSALRDWVAPDIGMDGPNYRALIREALKFKQGYPDRAREVLLGRAIYFLFFNPSLRTRSSFVTGLSKMGGLPIVLDPDGIYTPALPGDEMPYATERISDVARVLSEFGDAIGIRMYGEPAKWVYGHAHRCIEAFAKWSGIPVINMECDRFHPCQALADVMTLTEKLGSLNARRLCISWAYSGSWHKPVAVPQSLLLAAAKCGMDITVSHPRGFELDAGVASTAGAFAKESGATLRFVNDFREGINGAEVVYAKSWCSLTCLPKHLGSPVNEARMTDLFEQHRDWCVTDEVMALAAPEAGYMHCLPADRGQEVSDGVLDGPRSWVFAQAGNRLHAQNAIMTKLLNPMCLS
ncbi:aspartate/ornithine carbamoyltransferase, Asp/Orn-binding region [Pandoraea terrae]|uniref:Aspartate/ornithine carbamoyltransferase, Asp/Orn-binding region n=1 Tax=Pandoraea terrae TaxID=1537710 RepID=A0A5E4YCJ3_9BURK|nr:ornithine carbamoyltransferase [Pandoraea terrae]VVE45883.1 aspartate/ornithine carbamoyltransferase, Asp/Orn-binding region [Pandoraea terrae]